MSKKKNIDLLNEELKRFKLLNEYDFYVGEEYEDKENNQLLDEEGEEGDLPPDDSNTAGAASGDTENNGGIDINDLDDNPEGDIAGGDAPEMGNDMSDTSTPDPMGDAGAMPDAEMGGEEEVDLDVTDLVTGTEEAKQSADMANQKIDQLMGMLDTLDNKLNSMDGITSKIDNLENELEKRVPTPEEKIEMRSLSSYPYNLKLTDFWAEKQGQYDVMGVNDDKAEPKEYTLTKGDVDSDYSESNIKNSFDDDMGYEEEDI